MNNWKETERNKLLKAFPGSFFNHNDEFIAERKSNTYFIFKNCESEDDVKCKVLEWLSRAAFKTEPFYKTKENDKFHKFMLAGINSYLGTSFTADDMEVIYTRLGNSVHHSLTQKFIKEYDINVLSA